MPIEIIPRDELVPDRQVAIELGGVTLMTIWRWSRRPELGFPRLIKVTNRNYRLRSELEAFKRRLVEQPREAA